MTTVTKQTRLNELFLKGTESERDEMFDFFMSKAIKKFLQK